MPNEETTANPPKPTRGPLRMNLPLTKQATDSIKAKSRHYPGQHGDFVIRLAKRYEAEHLAEDLLAIVEEKESERRKELGIEPAQNIAPTEDLLPGERIDPAQFKKEPWEA